MVSHLYSISFPIYADSILSKVMPTLFSDIIKRMDDQWGDTGKIDPFNDVYYLVFQMTVRMATCRELAEDWAAIHRLFRLYWTLEKSATPVGVLLPWLPSKASRDKKQATAEMYNMMCGYVDSRRSAQEPGTDAIDLLIAQGEDNMSIVGVGRSHALFVGSLIPSISVHFFHCFCGCRQYRNDLCVSCRRSLG